MGEKEDGVALKDEDLSIIDSVSRFPRPFSTRGCSLEHPGHHLGAAAGSRGPEPRGPQSGSPSGALFEADPLDALHGVR